MRRQHWFSGHVNIRLPPPHRIIESEPPSRRWPRMPVKSLNAKSAESQPAMNKLTTGELFGPLGNN